MCAALAAASASSGEYWALVKAAAHMSLENSKLTLGSDLKIRQMLAATHTAINSKKFMVRLSMPCALR